MTERDEIAQVLVDQQEAILAAWFLHCPQPPEGSQAEGSVAETLRQGLCAIVALLHRGDDEPLSRFADVVAFHAHGAGLGASQAIPALLAFKPVCMAALQEHGWDSPRLLWASEQLDQVVGGAVSRFGERYAALVEMHLADQVQRLKTSEEQLLAQATELAERRRESEQRVREIEALNRGAMALNSTLEVDRLLDLVANQAAELMATGLSAVYRWDAESGELHGLASTGLPREAMLQIAKGVSLVPLDVRRVIEEHRPLAIPDMERASNRLPDAALKVAREQGIKASLAAPLVAGNHLFGYLAIYYSSPRAFTDHEVALLSTFAESAATALENARLYGQARRVSALEERNRIAREIHDTLAQDLSGLVLQLQGVDRYLDRDTEVAREELTEAVRLARGALHEARRSVWEFRARPLAEASLAEAIRAEVSKFRPEEPSVEFRLEGEPVPLSPEVEHNLYRIAQEALANVRRHASARSAAVTLRFSPGQVELEIRDDGVGFSHLGWVGSETEHFGLLGMRDRAVLVGGDLTVESSPGEGTRIRARIPLSRRDKANHGH